MAEDQNRRRLRVGRVERFEVSVQRRRVFEVLRLTHHDHQPFGSHGEAHGGVYHRLHIRFRAEEGDQIEISILRLQKTVYQEIDEVVDVIPLLAHQIIDRPHITGSHVTHDHFVRDDVGRLLGHYQSNFKCLTVFRSPCKSRKDSIPMRTWVAAKLEVT